MPSDKELGNQLIVEALSRIDGKMDRFDTKLDGLDDRMDGFDKVQIKQQGLLEEHIRRTNLLEEHVEAAKKTADESLPKTVQTVILAERQKLLFQVGKIAVLLAGTGVGGVALKEGITALLKAWNP